MDWHVYTRRNSGTALASQIMLHASEGIPQNLDGMWHGEVQELVELQAAAEAVGDDPVRIDLTDLAHQVAAHVAVRAGIHHLPYPLFRFRGFHFFLLRHFNLYLSVSIGTLVAARYFRVDGQ